MKRMVISMDKNIGKRLDGRYEITELIGVGGMADVYKAMDVVENKVVAVKILKNEFADNDDFVRRFRNESKAIAVLSHPNIVKIYDVGFTDKMQFIVMEYIDGITLKEFMEQQGVLKWKDAVYFIIQVLRALQHAHDRGIVHRDIKPQNIMLFPDGTIKVMDFGIARFAREEGKTLSDKAIGSVHYISPEQAKGAATDEKSDIYSVGVMLYEMLTGVKPFDGETPVAIALMHMQNTAKPPRSINDAIPEGLEEIVMRAMQKEPSKRYQSASEMIKDIEEFKKNPSVVFGYNSVPSAAAPVINDGGDTEKTQYFTRTKDTKSVPYGGGAAKAAPAVRTKTAVKTKNDYDDDNEDDDEESVSKSSYLIVTLTAITAAVVIVVFVFIALQIIPIIKNEQDTDTMPDLRGVNYLDAKSTFAEYFDLSVSSQEYSSVYDEGVIIDQTPKAGSKFVVKNTEVKVKVSRGPQMVTVQNVYDLEANEAQQMLKNQGFSVSIIFKVSDVQENNVISTEPERNSQAEVGSTVIMYVSQGPEVQDVIVPNVVGMASEDAEQLLKSKGLLVTVNKVDSFADKGEVLEQSITELDENGEQNVVTAGTEIVITVSSGIPPASDANITFAVPSGLVGTGEFKAYINGNVAGTQNVDNMAFVNTVTITVNGAMVQTVGIEATNTDTDKSAKIGEYVVDFNEGTVTEMSLDRDAFKEVFAEEEETEAETEETPDEESEESDITPVHPSNEDSSTEDNSQSDDTVSEGWWQTILNNDDEGVG